MAARSECGSADGDRDRRSLGEWRCEHTAEDVPRPAGVYDTDGLGYLPDEDFATTRAEDQSPIGSQRDGPRARQPSCGPGVDRADDRWTFRAGHGG